jgi:thiol-disulfide isomerase/thioredoxin
MVTLFLYETTEFWTSKLIKDLRLDQRDHTGDTKIRLNFNITMLDLRCEWAVIDVVSALGTDQNVTAHVTKWDLNADGVRKSYKGRNRSQKDIDHFDETVKDTIDELHENGEDALSLNGETLEWAKDNFEYLFVDFFASWCSHCQALAPTWETLAELMSDHHYYHLDDDEIEKPDTAKTAEEHMEGGEEAEKHFQQVQIAKVDCVEHADVCGEYDIRAYPTLRLFVEGMPWKEAVSDSSEGSLGHMGSSDYAGHRTVLEMVEWLHFVEQQVQGNEHLRTLHKAHEDARNRLEDDDFKADMDKIWNDPAIQKKKARHHAVGKKWKDDEHPGCQLAGHLLLDRAPGNFHILARSKHHDLAPFMTNVSHMVNELYIGDPTAMHWIQKKRSKVPTEVEPTITPLNGNAYLTEELHEAYHHYIKLIATKIDGMKVGSRELVFYQMLANSQLAYYDKSLTPEAKFAYDLSPIAVKYSFRSRKWYAYLTSIFAIIGGVFTVVGMIEAVLGRFVSRVGSKGGGSSNSHRRPMR